MYLSYELKDSINRFADDFIDANNLESLDDLEHLIKDLGGRVVEDYNLSEYFEGYVRKGGNSDFSFEVIISDKTPEFRRKFVLANSIGSLIVGLNFLDEYKWVKSQSVWRNFGTSIHHEVAEEFALCLLMPKNDYLTMINQYTSSNDTVDVKGISSYFGVSENTAYKRGKSLGCLE